MSFKQKLVQANPAVQQPVFGPVDPSEPYHLVNQRGRPAKPLTDVLPPVAASNQAEGPAEAVETPPHTEEQVQGQMVMGVGQAAPADGRQMLTLGIAAIAVFWLLFS
jgi:hypothetical protein